jgi:cyclopropane fatty-acyl-phospholipid synthase-like methyltransferase
MSMVLLEMPNWLGLPMRPPPARSQPAVKSVLPPATEEDSLALSLTVWPPERLAVAFLLWAEGYHFPGGDLEVMRLIKTVRIVAGSDMLLVGAGAGGPACLLASRLGVTVHAFESDPGLAKAARGRVAALNLERRVTLARWNPREPRFPRGACQLGLALEPLHGERPEPVFAALRAALRPGAQLVITELVADSPLDPDDPTIADWALRECRDPAALPSERTVTRVLGRLGFAIRAVEDISRRQVHQAMTGWRSVNRELSAHQPERSVIDAAEREAALWAQRLHLFQSGHLRLVRWQLAGGG